MAIHFNDLGALHQANEGLEVSLNRQPDFIIAIAADVPAVIVLGQGGVAHYLVPRERWNDWCKRTPATLADEGFPTVIAFGPEVD